VAVATEANVADNMDINDGDVDIERTRAGSHHARVFSMKAAVSPLRGNKK